MIQADLEMFCDDCGDSPSGRPSEEVEFVMNAASDWRDDLHVKGWRYVGWRDLCPECAEIDGEGESDE